MIASTVCQRDEVEGKPGLWGRLVVTRADGSDPEVLAEQFVSDAAAAAHVAQQQHVLAEIAPDHDWQADVQCHAAPGSPAWSPDSSSIAFLAAMPFDPEGVYYRHQTEVWICDLGRGELARVTHDDVAQHSLIWR
jgi:hypothetical protein